MFKLQSMDHVTVSFSSFISFLCYQNDGSAAWDYGHGSRTIFTISNSAYYSLKGRNHQRSGYWKGQQHSQIHGAMAYPGICNSQAGITLEQQQQQFHARDLHHQLVPALPATHSVQFWLPQAINSQLPCHTCFVPIMIIHLSCLHHFIGGLHVNKLEYTPPYFLSPGEDWQTAHFGTPNFRKVERARRPTVPSITRGMEPPL